jgi:hypothetical protein
MTQVFVHARDSKGAPLVAHHFEFEIVPRKGEEVVVDFDEQQFHLEVVGVTHFSTGPTSFAAQVSNVHIACKLVQ